MSLTGMPLVRCENLRKSAEWINQQLEEQSAYFVPLYKGKVLVSIGGLVKLTCQHVKQFVSSVNKAIFLGLTSEKKAACFTIDFSHLDEQLLEQTTLTLKLGEAAPSWQHLRFAINQLSENDAAICGFAQAMVNWHVSHQFCGYCGNELITREGGHAKKCSNDECNKWVFPRTDPVVIMLVEHTDSQGVKRCLLAGHQRTGGQVVSTLAGFVDPGESIEEGAIREVYEEVGLQVDSLEYITSQPWPFPSSLMLGFYMKVSDDALNIDHNELTHAIWCTKEQIAELDDWGAEGDGTQIPGKHSIARYLIDKWCEGKLLNC